jgi:ATP-binding cassette subfamily B (MDR/TAP) protein 1
MNIPCSGAVSARLATDASTVRTLVGDTLALIVQNIATVIAGLVLAFSANWILSFMVLAVASLLIIHEYMKAKFLKGFSAGAKVGLLNISFAVSTIEIYTCILVYCLS